MQEEIPMIAIDGGPCSGKTSVMAMITEKLSNFGFKVFIVPEAATIIINSGFDPRVFRNEDEILRIQEAIFNTQLHLEQQCADTADKLRYAINEQKPLLLCDRGIIGAKAYFPERCSGYFETLAKLKGLETAELMNRYNGVIHLVTAAEGAEKFYTLENNKARRENLEEAKAIDERIKNCWIGHPHLKVIDNSTDFEGKKHRVLTAICRFLEIPAPIEIERKFLVKMVDMLSVRSIACVSDLVNDANLVRVSVMSRLWITCLRGEKILVIDSDRSIDWVTNLTLIRKFCIASVMSRDWVVCFNAVNIFVVVSVRSIEFVICRNGENILIEISDKSMESVTSFTLTM